MPLGGKFQMKPNSIHSIHPVDGHGEEDVELKCATVTAGLRCG
jgi:hypothetical protein